MEQSEEWRPVVGFEGRYEVSNLGRLRRTCNERILKPSSARGCMLVTLRKDRKARSYTVARLVAFAFLGAPDNSESVVGHLDGDTCNNALKNLYWTTNGYLLQTPRIVALLKAARSSPEARAAWAKRMEGYGDTPEGAARLRKMTDAAALHNIKKIMCLETGVIYPSIKAASAAFGLSGGAISTKLLRAKTAQYNKFSTRGKPVFHFRLYDPEEWKPKERIWRPVVGFEGKYEVSNMGEVRNAKTKRPKKVCWDKEGKPDYVGLSVNGNKGRTLTVPRMVAEAFIPKVYGSSVVGHRDGDRHNNCVTNLFWSSKRGVATPISKARYMERLPRRQIICIETGKLYSSIREAAKDCNMREGTIGMACKRAEKGVRYTVRNARGRSSLHFRYADQ